MKLISFILLFALVSLAIAACSPSPTPLPPATTAPQSAPANNAAVPGELVGRWQYNGSSLRATYTFNADGTYFIELVSSTGTPACSNPPEVDQSQGTFSVSGDTIHYSQLVGTITCVNVQTASSNIISPQGTFSFNPAEPNKLVIDSFTYTKQ